MTSLHLNATDHISSGEVMILLAVVSLLPSISGLLTDPGPLCPGDMATLSCNITGGRVQQWRYNTMEVGVGIIPLAGQVPAVPAVPMVVDGVEFRLSLLSTSGAPYLATQIAFVASERMDGGMLECAVSLALPPVLIETLTIQIGARGELDYQKCSRRSYDMRQW